MQTVGAKSAYVICVEREVWGKRVGVLPPDVSLSVNRACAAGVSSVYAYIRYPSLWFLCISFVSACELCLYRYGYVDFPSHAAAVAALKYFLQSGEDPYAPHDRRSGPQQEGTHRLICDNEGVSKKMELCGKAFVLAPSIPMKNHRWILAPVNKVRHPDSVKEVFFFFVVFESVFFCSVLPGLPLFIHSRLLSSEPPLIIAAYPYTYMHR